VQECIISIPAITEDLNDAVCSLNTEPHKQAVNIQLLGSKGGYYTRQACTRYSIGDDFEVNVSRSTIYIAFLCKDIGS
jgi:hypothetical protein